ncbi:MAG: TonB-dependent receptor plug domain-containing protein, partial [Bacteroidota bacterium]|nr:TonB-dependent receptor plug domain-containing protein [Bacteroidota bacterium]
MKLTSFFILVLTLQMSASVYSQTTTMSVKLKNSTLQELFLQIEKSSNYRFFYNNDEVDVNQRISVDAEEKTVGKILEAAFEGLPYSFKELENKLILIERNGAKPNPIGSTMQQQKSVSGKVTDSSGASLPGVSIVIKGTTNGTISDGNGNFSLSNIPENATLQFSFVGMKGQEIIVGNQSVINVTLAEETIGIEEVVAIGYGSSRKKDLVGSVVSVEASKINNQTVQNVTQALQGKVAGLQITNNGTPGSSPQVRLRGLGTVTDGSGPLYVVDEVIVPNISFLAPGDIENVTVLKDASSAAIYGVRAAGGVILITTKRGTDSKPTISFNSYVGIKKAANIVDIANGPEYIQLYNEALQYRGLTSGQLDPSKYSSHNYYDDILNNNIVTISQ